MEKDVIIVTGASSGMGKFMARKFANEGANVVITGRNEENLQKAKLEIQSHAKGKVNTVVMDVRNPDDVEKMVNEKVEFFGRIEYLVYNEEGNFVDTIDEL